MLLIYLIVNLLTTWTIYDEFIKGLYYNSDFMFSLDDV